MINRDYIKLMKKVVSAQYDQYKENLGYVDRKFYETVELKEAVKSIQETFTMFGLAKLTENDFDSAFIIAIREVKFKKQTGMPISLGIMSEEATKREWLTKERQETLGWGGVELNNYRDRYIEYLRSQDRSESYIKETQRSSLDILKRMGDPKTEEDFFVKGLVVGSVQSGKTANFNAVINSAVDTGYGLIIVLSGVIEDLRTQTQRRIEKEVEGKYEKGNYIGVGDIVSFGAHGSHSAVHQVVIPTSMETDFRKTIKEADFSLANKNILICKKNVSVLKNLILWLNNYLSRNKDKISIPLLIIDDEADNASINNLGEKGAEYASKINGHIRALLGLFTKKTYLGYTATPFANVLQDRNEMPRRKWEIVDKNEVYEFDQVDNLFPQDFIELLFPPPNYIGAKHFFETRLDDIKKIEPLVAHAVTDYYESFPSRIIKDSEEPTTEFGRHTRAATKEDLFPEFIPESLKEAIVCYVISIAIRIARKPEMITSALYQPHSTMLIHISRFTKWQIRTEKLVLDFVKYLETGLENDLPNTPGSIYEEFERVWYKHYAYVMDNIKSYLPEKYEDEFLVAKTFRDIKPLLIKAIDGIEVKAINSELPDNTLSYPDDVEKKYIAIGGNRLSRGFTLEGLSVNYFVRTTNFADTLLQMGRWFGYRPGYLDCCKLFSNKESLDKFDQVTATIEDLEQKFIDMNKDPSNTPSDYALKVLNHPGALKVTRGTILKNTEEIKFSYSDQLVQTTKFKIDNSLISLAWSSFKDHINKLSNDINVIRNDKGNAEYLSYEPDTVDQLFDFFDLNSTFGGLGVNFEDVKLFIKNCNKEGKLKNWTVLIKAEGRGGNVDFDELGFPGLQIKKTMREGPAEGRWRDTFIEDGVFSAGAGSANILTGAKDVKYRLTDEDVLAAELQFKADKKDEFRKLHPDWSDEYIDKKVNLINIPEKVYRQSMSDNEGILVIYLIDLEKIFDYKGKPIPELCKVRDGIEDLSTPLIGFALGIPQVNGAVSGTYLISKFHEDGLSEEPFYDEDDAGIFEE